MRHKGSSLKSYSMSTEVSQRANNNNSSLRDPENVKSIQDIFIHCHGYALFELWLLVDLVILVTGLVANLVLLWLFLRERKALSASKLLGVNLAVMDLIYLLLFPVTVYTDIYSLGLTSDTINTTNMLQAQSEASSNPVDTARDVSSILNLIGCPLLLACMCVERYVAVAQPVLYLSLSRRWEYRVVVSLVVWIFTVTLCLLTVLMKGINKLLLSVAVIVCCLFVIMLASLVGVVWSLQQHSPAHTTRGNHAHFQAPPPQPPLKRRAVNNVLAVLVPAVLSYLPVVFLIPVLSNLQSRKVLLNETWCNLLYGLLFFPNFGLFIGPMFYLAKARQILCRWGGRGTRG